MAKRKREVLTSELRQQLNSNRHGRLTPGQWLTITLDPLITMLILLAPALIVLSWRLPALLARLWLVALVVVLVTGIPLVLRARRFARMPLTYRLLYPSHQPLGRWRFWRSPLFYDDRGRVYRFARWLTPRYPVQSDHVYMVYCLDAGREYVLCSLLPLTHPDAESFQPSTEFQRLNQRRTKAVPNT